MTVNHKTDVISVLIALVSNHIKIPSTTQGQNEYWDEISQPVGIGEAAGDHRDMGCLYIRR